MKHAVSHDLGLARAKQVAQAAFDAYTAKFSQYNPKAVWRDERRADIGFNVKGMSLSGTMEVNDTSITMDLEVPFLLRPFKGTALGVIEKEIQEWIQKAKLGQL
ncbi:MAG: polyhydroxyalkanoic acid system family protein [Polyangiaceae bacterium]|nr:polyhydroxyalkanoic acid system family protein [Polyangiaceae bacterium]